MADGRFNPRVIPRVPPSKLEDLIGERIYGLSGNMNMVYESMIMPGELILTWAIREYDKFVNIRSSWFMVGSTFLS